MKTALSSLLIAVIVANAMPVSAGSPPPPKHHAPTVHGSRTQRVYGAPIQPPIMQKARTKKRPNTATVQADNKAGNKADNKAANQAANAAAKKKRADAARRAKADLEYRRAHPAVAEQLTHQK